MWLKCVSPEKSIVSVPQARNQFRFTKKYVFSACCLTFCAIGRFCLKYERLASLRQSFMWWLFYSFLVFEHKTCLQPFFISDSIMSSDGFKRENRRFIFHICDFEVSYFYGICVGWKFHCAKFDGDRHIFRPKSFENVMRLNRHILFFRRFNERKPNPELEIINNHNAAPFEIYRRITKCECISMWASWTESQTTFPGWHKILTFIASTGTSGSMRAHERNVS